MKRALLAAWRQGAQAIDAEAVGRALKAGDEGHAVRLIQTAIQKPTLAALHPRIARAFVIGSQLGLDHLKSKKAVKDGQSLISLDAVNAAALDWASQHAADLVQTDDDVKQIIRMLVGDSLSGDATPQELGDALLSVINLTPQQAQAVQTYGDGLLADGEDPDSVASQMSDYAGELLSDRAQTISRTELIGALNAGQQSLWDEAVSAGEIDSGAMVKVWIATDDDLTDPICQDLDGTTAPIDGTFDGGYDHPPAHPNCRCAVGLDYA